MPPEDKRLLPHRSRLLSIALAAVLVASVGWSTAGADEPGDDPGPQIATDLPLGQLAIAVKAQLQNLATAAQQAVSGVLTDVAEAPDPPKTRQARKKAQRKAKRLAGQRRQERKPSTKKRLQLVKTITGGGLSPKSIVADQNGRYYAMNMMYNHSISVFDRRYKRIKTIDDSIDLAKFGFPGHHGKVQGAPVEAAVSPNGKRIYVSNYSMYGPGFRNQGFDLCTSRDRIDRGFVYEINTRTLRKTDAIKVGEVPKYLAVTPNGRYLLVGNWCSWDISVVDLRKNNKEVRRIDAGVAPRGIAFSPNSKTAYVTLVGDDQILVLDMRTFRVKRRITNIGKRPRHLVMSPNGRNLYITSQGEEKPRVTDGQILKYDTRKREIVARSKRLTEPRTTVMSDDGKSLYVVDYHPGTLVKLDAKNLNLVQVKYLGYHPIGVTYDNASDKIWVAGYGGAVWVLKDK